MHHTTHFQTRKLNCLSKRDKSSAGRIDPRAVDVCAALNRRDEYYTTSSCAGRCFLYCGDGIKSWHSGGSGSGGVDSTGDGVTADNAAENDGGDDGNGGAKKLGFFRRYRVNHDLVREPRRYFDLTTLVDGRDPTGGGDPIPVVGQFDNGNNAGFKSKLDDSLRDASPIWLRFEPFILHVMCRSLRAASVLMALARPSFKNVGLTSWNTGGVGDEGYNNDGEMEDGSNKNQQCKGGGPRYLVAIWGDEGLDMPLSLPTSPGKGLFYNPDDDDDGGGDEGCGGGTANMAQWLSQLVNERHARNWNKIDRFAKALRGLEEGDVDAVEQNSGIDGAIHDIDRVELDVQSDANGYHDDGMSGALNSPRSKKGSSGLPIPRSYDGERKNLIWLPINSIVVFTDICASNLFHGMKLLGMLRY